MPTTTSRPLAGIRTVDAVADDRWDAYVRAHPDANAYHLSAWMPILARCYGYRPAALASVGDGQLSGVLPLMGRRGPVSGRRLRSLPAVHTAGPLADTPELSAALVRAAFDVGSTHGLHVNVDSRVGGLDRLDSRLQVERRPPSWMLDVPADPDAWLKERSQNLRRGIKRAVKAGVAVREAHDEPTIRAWYRHYLVTMRRHRSVPRPLRQILLARSELPPGVFRMFVAERDGRLLAGGIWHLFNGTIELLYNASDEASWEHRPNHALYHEVLRWAAARQLSRLDFGFAWPESPLAQFKAAWGATPIPEYRYVDRAASPPPDAGSQLDTVSDERPGRIKGLVDRAWARAPLNATRAAGTLAYRYL